MLWQQLLLSWEGLLSWSSCIQSLLEWRVPSFTNSIDDSECDMTKSKESFWTFPFSVPSRSYSSCLWLEFPNLSPLTNPEWDSSKGRSSFFFSQGKTVLLEFATLGLEGGQLAVVSRKGREKLELKLANMSQEMRAESLQHRMGLGGKGRWVWQRLCGDPPCAGVLNLTSCSIF
jgi:hypothetical protein